MKSSVFALLVTYNPDLELLDNSIDTLLGQVSKILIVDNASFNASEIKSRYSSVADLMFLDHNAGISGAYNIGINIASKNGYEFILFLDQDSILQKSAVKILLSGFERDSRIAVSVPSIFDKNTGDLVTVSGDYDKIRTIINSGSLFRLSIFSTIGNFDESLFIDFVDVEMSLRLQHNRMIMIRSSKAILEHQLGDTIIRRFGCIKFNVTNHSAHRRFLISKNRLLVYRKYFVEFPFYILKDSLSFIKMIFSIFLFESNKIDKGKSLLSGIFAGLKTQQ